MSEGFRMKSVAGLLVFAMVVFLPMSVRAGERLSIGKNMANIRSGPGTSHEILWQIEQYHPIVVVEKQGNWYRFKDYEDDMGWVHNSLVSKTDSVISIKGGCNVRSGPGTSNPVVFVVEKGVPFKVLERKGNWIHIEHSDGDRGWIHKNLVW